MDWLKKLLGDDLYSKVTEKLGDTKILQDDGSYIKKENMIPKKRLDEEIQKVKNLKDQLTEKDGTITELNESLGKLKKAAEGSEELQKQITELQAKLDETQTESAKKVKDMRIGSEIETIFGDEKVESDYKEFLKDKIVLESVTVSEDGKTVAGIKEQIPGLKELFPKFFGEKKSQGVDFVPGGDGDGGEKFFTQEEVKKMSPTEVQANMEAIDESRPQWNKKT